VLAFNDRYRLIELRWSDDDQSLARVSITDGEVYEFDSPPPPSGFEFFGCNGLTLSIDSLGRLLTAVRDDDAVWIAAWQPETDEWSLLGLPLADVDGMRVYALGGEIVYAVGYGSAATWLAGDERVVHDLEDGDQLVFPIAPNGFPEAGWIEQ
jgi:hypothetical protein